MDVDDQLTEGKRKTVRVHIAIIDYFTQILRDLLSSKIAAKDLYNNNVLGKYKTSDKGNILGLWEDIFKKEGHLELIKKATDYAEFDITLLYQCLRNFCTWAPKEEPTSGWGSKQMPAAGQETVGDDVERIRLLRNKFYGHISTFEISNQVYEDCWTIISDVCKRMEKHLNSTSYYQDIKKIEKQHLDLDSFQSMKKYINKHIEGIEKLSKDQHQEVMTTLQNITGYLKQNPQRETDIFGKKELWKNEGILKDSNLADIARKIGKEYLLFLCDLSLSVPEIDQIQLENPNQVVMQVIKGLALWKNKEQDRSSEDLVKDLLNALEKNDRHDLVDELTERYQFQVTIGECKKEKNDLTIVCNISSTSDLSFSVTWKKDGSNIDINESREKYRVGNQLEPSLTIHNFGDDCGHYQCFVTSVMGEIGSNILNLNLPVVNVLSPFHSPSAPANIVIPCEVSYDKSTNLSSIVWTKNDVKIGKKDEYAGGDIGNTSLTIFNGGKKDRGKYICSATNVVGVGKSTVLLDVPAVSLTGPSAVNFEERAVFIADCSSHFEITSYKWQKKAPNTVYTTLDKKKYTGSTEDKLVIKGAKLSDTAEYRLLAENIFGEGESNGIQLTVKEDIFGKKELWKNIDECEGITRKDRLKRYRKLFWNTKENTLSCTDQELLTHLGPPYEYVDLESKDDNMDFDSEDSKKMTLWDFLHENGDISNNIKFWFAKSSDNSIIERYCVSSEYFRQEKETAICIPSAFLTEFVKKVDINILKHRTLKDKSIYPCVSDILKIPTEILYSGDDAVQNYLKQLSKGNVKVYHARGMIVGCAGAGKTTLLKKLKELPLEDILDTKSTRGVDIQADVFTVSGTEISVTSEKIVTHFNIKTSTTKMTDTMSDKQEYEVSPDEYHTNLTERGSINEQENLTNKTDGIYDQSFVENKHDDGVEDKMSSENTYTDSKVAVQTKKSPMKIAEKQALGGSDEKVPRVQEKHALKVENKYDDGVEIKMSSENTYTDSQVAVQTEKSPKKIVEKQALGRSDENVPGVQEKQALDPIQYLSLLSAIKENAPQTITIFDFAGQLAYYVTHELYLNPRAFYVLVIDMTKDLDDLVKGEPVFVRWTYKELIQHWMKMIHVIHRFAPVIPVATHAEGKSKEDIEKFFVQIWKLIPEDIRKCHLNYKHQFAVELQNSFGIAEIKESILKIVSTSKHWGEFRPSSWVMFESYLMNNKAKIKVMKMEDLWTENTKLPKEYQLEKKDDMIKMLQFFHDTGTIVYFYEDVLRDDIILDVPWFVDSFKHIITDPVHATEDLVRLSDTFVSKHFTCEEALDDLKKSGILSVSLLHAIWKFFEIMKSDHKDQNMQGTMRYMERLGMIAKITSNPEDMWYVPCMNSRLFSKEEFKNYSVSSTLCFKFKFLPLSIYYRLIASCINFLHFKIFSWPKPEYFHKNAVLIYKTAFDYKYYFLIGCVELQGTIDIQVLIEKDFELDRKNSSNFKNEIIDQLENLMKTFHTDLERFEIGYRCRNTIFSDKTAGHFIPESKFKDTTITCPECKPPNRILCEDVLYPWNKEGETADRNNEENIRTAPGEPLPSPIPKRSLNQTVNQNTFHDDPVRDRRQPGPDNKPDALPETAQDTSATSAATPMSFFGKLSKISAQTRKAKDDSNRDVGGNVASQGVRFILETKLRVPGVSDCRHISCVSSESAWVSDRVYRLRQVDKHGRVIKTVSGRRTLWYGSHTVTRDGDLLFIDINDRHVYRVAGEEQILTLQTDQCRLVCIFSSPRNGDLLIGGYRDDRGEGRGAVLRYSGAGDVCIQEIERDREGRHLYTEPLYITENMNGDVIVSDPYKLVVVDKSGRHRFTYTRHPSGSGFWPRGVCTDTSGRILVCDEYSNSVHILTRDGEFLSLLQTRDHGIWTPWSICMDNEQRVWVVDASSNRVCIYRYPAPQ